MVIGRRQRLLGVLCKCIKSLALNNCPPRTQQRTTTARRKLWL
jgi:hypothetical protein